MVPLAVPNDLGGWVCKWVATVYGRGAGEACKDGIVGTCLLRACFEEWYYVRNARGEAGNSV